MKKKKDCFQGICNGILDTLQSTALGDKIGSIEYDEAKSNVIICERLGEHWTYNVTTSDGLKFAHDLFENILSKLQKSA